jgi:hypothetical protein
MYDYNWKAIVASVLGAALVILLLLSVFMWPFKKVANGYVGLSYGGGVFEGQHFQGEHVGPKGMFINGFADQLYLYPTTLRTYIVSQVAGEGDREGSDAITALDANGVDITYEVAVYFKLNLDVLREFHEKIGLKYHAWCGAGAPNCSDGWEHMLNDTLRQQLENALQAATRSHTTDEFLLVETIRQIQTEIELNLKDNVNRVLGSGAETEFFCGPDYVPGGNICPDFSVVVKKPTLPGEVVTRYRQVQEAEITVETRRQEVEQARLQAEAINELNEALSSASSSEAYVLLKAIEAGNITFWVIPQSADLTLQTPNAATTQGGGTP